MNGTSIWKRSVLAVGCVALGLSVGMGAAMAAEGDGGSEAATVPPQASRVLRLTVPDFVDGKHDLQVVLLHRDGYFHAAHAVIPTRDNLVHRVDPDPAHPFEYVYKDGTKPVMGPKFTGTYAYKIPEWVKLSKQYDAGELLVRFPEKVPAMTWDPKTRTLTGTFEVFVMPPEEANVFGGNMPVNMPPWRVALKLQEQDGSLTGTGAAWTYARDDMTFGMGADRREVSVLGRWDEAFWKPAPGPTSPRGATGRRCAAPT